MWPKPSPDWGRKGTQPKGSAGPKPRPNGRVVATKPSRNPDILDPRLLIVHDDQIPGVRWGYVYCGTDQDGREWWHWGPSRISRPAPVLRPEDV